jgi:hypothetical protein
MCIYICKHIYVSIYIKRILIENPTIKRSADKERVIEDQDAVVTMLACFTYAPYVKIKELELFIDLK